MQSWFIHQRATFALDKAKMPNTLKAGWVLCWGWHTMRRIAHRNVGWVSFLRVFDKLCGKLAKLAGPNAQDQATLSREEREKKNVENHSFISSLYFFEKKRWFEEHSDFTQRASVLDLLFKEWQRKTKRLIAVNCMYTIRTNIRYNVENTIT